MLIVLKITLVVIFCFGLLAVLVKEPLGWATVWLSTAVFTWLTGLGNITLKFLLLLLLIMIIAYAVGYLLKKVFSLGQQQGWGETVTNLSGGLIFLFTVLVFLGPVAGLPLWWLAVGYDLLNKIGSSDRQFVVFLGLTLLRTGLYLAIVINIIVRVF